MRFFEFGKGISLAADANGSVVHMGTNDHPFVPGYDAIACIFTDDLADCTVRIQGNDTDPTMTTGNVDLATIAAATAPVALANVKIMQYMRYQIDEGSSGAGIASIYLLG